MNCEKCCLLCKLPKVNKVNFASYHGLCEEHSTQEVGVKTVCMHCKSKVLVLFQKPFDDTTSLIKNGKDVSKESAEKKIAEAYLGPTSKVNSENSLEKKIKSEYLLNSPEYSRIVENPLKIKQAEGFKPNLPKSCIIPIESLCINEKLELSSIVFPFSEVTPVVIPDSTLSRVTKCCFNCKKRNRRIGLPQPSQNCENYSDSDQKSPSFARKFGICILSILLYFIYILTCFWFFQCCFIKYCCKNWSYKFCTIRILFCLVCCKSSKTPAKIWMKIVNLKLSNN